MKVKKLLFPLSGLVLASLSLLSVNAQSTKEVPITSTQEAAIVMANTAIPSEVSGDKQWTASMLRQPPVGDNLEVRMATVLVKEGQEEAFKEIVTRNMKLSIAKEPGVYMIYGTQAKDNPRQFTFFEVYANPEAYQFHTQTEHFKNYIAQTKDMLEDKNLTPLNNMLLLSKGYDLSNKAF